MNLRRKAPLLIDDGGDDDVANVGSYLFDAGEVLQHPRAHFPRRQCLARIGCRVGHVFGGGWEIEQARRQPFFIHPIEDKREPHAIGSDTGVLGLPLEPFLAVGRRTGARIATRYHDHVGVNIDGEFHRSRMDDGAVRCDHSDAGASLYRLHDTAQQHRSNGNGRNDLPKHLAMIHLFS